MNTVEQSLKEGRVGCRFCLMCAFPLAFCDVAHKTAAGKGEEEGRERRKRSFAFFSLRKKRKSKRGEEEESAFTKKRERGEKINNSRKSVHPDGVQQPEVYRPRGARTTKGRPTRDPEECLESGEWLCPGRPSWPPVQKWWRAGLGSFGRECR